MTEACAALVERGDPDRFLATMAAPVPSREALFILYAFNLEIARAPWVSKEPMIAEMRLQWWRDVVAEPTPRAHEVAGPLHGLTQRAELPLDVLDRLIAARRWDIYRDAFADRPAFDAYIDDTAGGLMWLAARALGAPDAAEGVVRDYAWGAGLAAYLRAVPGLEERGCKPLVDGRPETVAALARDGLARLAKARARCNRVPKQVAAALLPGWQAEPLLRLAAADPLVVAEGRMEVSEFTRRGRLLWQALSGRW